MCFLMCVVSVRRSSLHVCHCLGTRLHAHIIIHFINDLVRESTDNELIASITIYSPVIHPLEEEVYKPEGSYVTIN